MISVCTQTLLKCDCLKNCLYVETVSSNKSFSANMSSPLIYKKWMHQDMLEISIAYVTLNNPWVNYFLPYHYNSFAFELPEGQYM